MTVFRQIILAFAFTTAAGTAQAALQFCNETDDIQSVAIGYQGASAWTSEGWWNIDPGACATVVGGDLTKRYYYYRSEVNGGDFPGEGYMFCTTPEEFEIVGDTDCASRGYDSESFREIDTGETATDFTFTLTAETTSPPKIGEGPANDTPATDETGLRICNSTGEIQSVSIGYEGDEGFLSEGWWNIDPDDCAKVLAGELQRRYYYYRAEVEAGPFEGEGYMFCTSPEVYTIVGDSDCESRGYDTESFSEIDTGPTARGYTFYITADGAAPPPQPDETPPAPTGEGAGLEVCNDTGEVQSVTIGYEGAEDWTSEGWWNIDPGDCAMPALDGVNRRYIYYRAEIDGGPFDGQNYFFCTTPEAFVIVGDSECEARGYDREEYAEVDTGGTTGLFTLTLVDPAGTDGPPSPEDDRDPFPDGPKPDDTPGEVVEESVPEVDGPEEPSFDFGLPDEEPAEEPAEETELPAEDPDAGPGEAPVEEPMEPVEEPMESVEEPMEPVEEPMEEPDEELDFDLDLDMDEMPAEDDDERRIRRGSTRGS
ncbi:DUF1036 domain-containing protein [Psychromarinibacter sp. C21-152]|uniref:DUF1036 domain-containing protein n=1 Tax=Psychromarinibacter sediminicola TaxID=3033385 RepID=A0AAE3NNH7_9RHOB|nr:DUF1036 domain-containing protein [Psychromarinibacter sediminicola]MDF0600568.1 DUF1036 domain-containing protein [Psychromarinibacter sediminicola]